MSSAIARPRIYLAGPDVFLPDAREAGARKRKLCSDAGFEGVYPLDGDLALDGLAKHQQARLISEGNEALMQSCAALIANLTPFRGVSADCGTAFEVGFMRALGRPVLGYSNTQLDYAARSRSHRAAGGLGAAFDGDRPDIDIEDFDHAENLMIAVAIEASGSRLIVHDASLRGRMTDLTAFKLCLDEAKRVFGAEAGTP